LQEQDAPATGGRDVPAMGTAGGGFGRLTIEVVPHQQQKPHK
jgi:hypothetical protein